MTAVMLSTPSLHVCSKSVNPLDASSFAVNDFTLFLMTFPCSIKTLERQVLPSVHFWILKFFHVSDISSSKTISSLLKSLYWSIKELPMTCAF